MRLHLVGKAVDQIFYEEIIAEPNPSRLRKLLGEDLFLELDQSLSADFSVLWGQIGAEKGTWSIRQFTSRW